METMKETATTDPTERLEKIRTLISELFSGSAFPDLIELAMATAISQRVVPDGPPVWLLFEGPPSSGKTSVVNLLRGLETSPDTLTVFVPKITLGSLTSGYKDATTKRRAPALLKTFHTRCWCNTEFSTLLAGRPEQVAPILSVLTAAFDGDFAAAFGNVTEQGEQGSPILRVESRFSLLGCITPEVRQQHTDLLSRLGPRFLSYRLQPLTDKEQGRAFDLVRQPGRSARLKDLWSLVRDHVRGVLKDTVTVTVPENADRILQALAQLVALGRTPVEGGDNELAASGGEDSTRVYQQLRALLISLAIVQGTTSPSPRALRLVRDVALSSFEPRRAEAVMAQRAWPVLVVRLPKDGEPPAFLHGMTVSQLADGACWSEKKAERVMKELCALGLYALVDPASVPLVESKPGAQPTLYEPTPALACLLNATFEDWPPRLVTWLEMIFDGAGAFTGRLSPSDAPLAAAAAEHQAVLKGKLHDTATRLMLAHPGLAEENPDGLSLLVIQEATGVSLVPAAPGEQEA